MRTDIVSVWIQLYANIETGESHDYNRLTAKDHPELGSAGNYGWGLGTLYDATSETSSADCPSVSARPLCDAQFHVTGGNWGSNGGLGGMIGTDNVCNDDCPWTVASDYEYDYAIYVRKATPVYYASCVAVAEAGETSGQYLLSSGDHVRACPCEGLLANITDSPYCRCRAGLLLH